MCRLTDPGKFEEIKTISTEKNASLGISGFIANFGAEVVQYFEGKREVVLELIEKIKADKRQNSFVRIIQGSLTKRV